MTEFPSFRDINIEIDGTPLPVLDFHLPAPGPDLDDPYLLTDYTVSNQVLVVEGDLHMTAEQHQELADWWAKRLEEELRRQIMGEPSEYQHSLRAAGVQV